MSQPQTQINAACAAENSSKGEPRFTAILGALLVDVASSEPGPTFETGLSLAQGGETYAPILAFPILATA